jgi:hypothetical protein
MPYLMAGTGASMATLAAQTAVLNAVAPERRGVTFGTSEVFRRAGGFILHFSPVCCSWRTVPAGRARVTRSLT